MSECTRLCWCGRQYTWDANIRDRKGVRATSSHCCCRSAMIPSCCWFSPLCITLYHYQASWSLNLIKITLKSTYNWTITTHEPSTSINFHQLYHQTNPSPQPSAPETTPSPRSHHCPATLQRQLESLGAWTTMRWSATPRRATASPGCGGDVTWWKWYEVIKYI